MGGNQRTKLTDHIRVTAKRELGLDRVLDDACPQLFQARDLRLREQLVTNAGQGGAAPQRQRRAKVRRGPLWLARRERAAALPGETLKIVHVNAVVGGSQQVGAGPGQHHLTTGGGPQRLPQSRNVHLQGVLRARGRMLSPQPLSQAIPGHRLVRVKKQDREQRPLLAAADVQEPAVNARLYRPEQPVIDHCQGPPRALRQALPSVKPLQRLRKPLQQPCSGRCELFVRSWHENQPAGRPATASSGGGRARRAGPLLSGTQTEAWGRNDETHLGLVSDTGAAPGPGGARGG